MTGQANRAPWIPMAALPVDLQARCAQSSEQREVKEGRVYQMSDGLVKFGFVMLAVGVIVALTTTRTTAFGAFGFRLLLLAGVLVFVALWLVIPRTRRFLGLRGQKLVVGPTSLVIVDAEAVRVLPAEELKLTPFNNVVVVVEYDGKCIDQGTHAAAYREALLEAQKTAADPAAREADRFRKAAAEAKPISEGQVTSARRRPALAACAAGVLVALMVETGPLHSRAAPAAEAAALAKSFTTDVRDKVDKRHSMLIKFGTNMVEEEKAGRRDKLLAAAKSGTEADMRAFLEKVESDDPDRPTIEAKLAESCAAKKPLIGAGLPRVLKHIEQLACRSATGTKFDFHYESTMDLNGQVGQSVMDDVAGRLKPAVVSANHVIAVVPGKPYVELKLAKEGGGVGEFLVVRATLIVHDSKGAALDQATLTATVRNPNYVAPTPPSYGGGSLGGSCPGMIPCGYGSDQWCCPIGSQCDPTGPVGKRCVSYY